MDLKVKVKEGMPLPEHAKKGDAGLDLRSTVTTAVHPKQVVMVGSGLSVEIPKGYFGLVAPRSSIATLHNVTLANTPGVIDSGYRGEIMLPLYNAGNETYMVKKGDRLAQLIIIPYEECVCIESDSLVETERGANGFGSTGVS